MRDLLRRDWETWAESDTTQPVSAVTPGTSETSVGLFPTFTRIIHRLRRRTAKFRGGLIGERDGHKQAHKDT
jgi:hypothetical protein